MSELEIRPDHETYVLERDGIIDWLYWLGSTIEKVNWPWDKIAFYDLATREATKLGFALGIESDVGQGLEKGDE